MVRSIHGLDWVSKNGSMSIYPILDRLGYECSQLSVLTPSTSKKTGKVTVTMYRYMPRDVSVAKEFVYVAWA